MELLQLMKERRSIRKYLTKRVEREKLDKFVEAGLFAPNPGGRQGTKIIMLDDYETIDKIGAYHPYKFLFSVRREYTNERKNNGSLWK